MLDRIITGAGNGIGLSIVKGLLDDARTSLIVAVDLIATNLEPLCTKSGGRLEIIIGDVSDRSTSERAVERVISLRGQLDTIILNAGILRPAGPLVQTKVDDWKRLFDVNFFSLVHTVRQPAGKLEFIFAHATSRCSLRSRNFASAAEKSS